MRAGVIAETMGIPNSSLSFHLTQLRLAGLVRRQQNHRAITYTANYEAMNALIGYLSENCCGTTSSGF